ncbi:MAG TPA: hypothetical protein PLR12_05025 [Clostridia bacterium]|nr:hypothetical protein [Clostridia bacterium]
MWICSRCQTANKEAYTQCVQCSAPRNARRFGAGTPLSAPSVQAAAPERRMQAEEPQEAPPPLRRQPKPAADAGAPRPAGGFVRAAGLALAVLLPALTLLLAVLRADLLKPLVEGLFLGGGSEAVQAPVQGAGFVVGAAESLAPVAESAGAPQALLGWVIYVATALAAALLALAPGLSLYALGHIARGVRRR